jgi:hypothetical protein
MLKSIQIRFLPAGGSFQQSGYPTVWVASPRNRFEMVLVSCADSSSLPTGITTDQTWENLRARTLTQDYTCNLKQARRPKHQAILGLPAGLFQGNNQPMTMVIESLRKVRTRLEMVEQARGASRGSKLTPTRQNPICMAERP